MKETQDSARIARAFAAQQSYGDPSREMRIIGVTGTNGKTTTVHLIDAIFTHAGYRSHALGTINSPLTTLGEPELAQELASLRDAGVEVVAMEVSSHGLAQHRVDAVRFDVTAFTNLTQDHLDYHHSMDEYFSAKKRLFLELESQASVINEITEAGRILGDEIAQAVPERTLIRVGAPGSLITSERGRETPSGTCFDLSVAGATFAVDLPLVGYHNVSNALVATGCAYASGIDLETIADALCDAPQIPGRLQWVDSDTGINVFVDYAHTPDALEHALIALRHITRGRLFVVFGCGGDRDQAKRPLMGRVATTHADRVIITTDNPRTEDPACIIDQIHEGIGHTHRGHCASQIDRATAIAQAIDEAHAGDTVLIAGKGHETYQIFADGTIDFSDAQVAGDALARKQSG